MYFDIYSQGNLIIRGTRILNTISFDCELNLAPSLTLELEADWYLVIKGREEIKIYLDDGKVFWGIIWNYSPVDKDKETMTLDVRHVITEWQYRQISVNHAIQNEELNIIYKGDKTTVSEENDETITASDFSLVKESQFGELPYDEWIAKAHATAWQTSNGDKVKITKVDYDPPEHDEDEFDITFSTAKGTSVKVKCTLYDKIEKGSRRTHSDKNNRETIAATPLTIYDADGMTAEDVKKKAKPKAWVYRHKNQKVAVTSVTTDFVNAVGEYHLTASTALGTSITVKIKVKAGDGGYSALDDPAVVDKLEDIYSDKNFAYPGWQIEFLDGSEDRMVDYVYSKQNKLEALTQTMELTDDLWWRVGMWNEKKVQIGVFGEEKPYVLSLKPSGKTNIRIIEEPRIEPDLENVVNVATVYSDKSDGGMSSLTLREVYNDPDLQKEGFPVVILRANANNERDYSMYIDQFPMLAPNNEIEYAVIDEESVALESGTIIEGSYSFNDMSPFQIDDEIVTDENRIKAAKTVYEATIKRLIQARRSYNFILMCEALPPDVNVGDKIRLLYDNKVLKLGSCSKYFKKLLALDDMFYITRITYNYDEVGAESCELTLTKWLKIQRETYNTQG